MTVNRNRLPFALIVLDGLGLNPSSEWNAVHHARKPTLDRLLANYPHTTLCTHGKRVGLPEGQMGNSEVGHLNIGGGRIVKQELTRINDAIEDKSLVALPELKKIFDAAAKGDQALHLIGLVSLGGVHSYIDHLEALVAAAVDYGLKHIFIHAITDGRDRPPTAAQEELARLEKFLSKQAGKFSGKSHDLGIATICGRYYAMDRDKRWERTQLAYDLYTEGTGDKFPDVQAGLRARVEQGQEDEFMKPFVVNPERFSRPPVVKDGDALLFFNFRTDRMRQIVSAFLGREQAAFPRSVKPRLSQLTTLTEYEADYPVDVLFKPTAVKNHFGQVVSQAGLSQLRIAETEKYPHVTYFFSGGVEQPEPGEERLLIPSPRDVPTYDHKPQMSAVQVTDLLIQKLNSRSVDVTILNFANCDMVGHTGVFDAAVKAVETVDSCLGRVLETLDKLNGSALIVADHGNAEQMVDYETGKPHTFHTMYPVPCVLYTSEPLPLILREGGALCDLAPTACDLLGLKQPAEMTGRSLLDIS